MRMLVLGAAGRTGSLVVSKALGHGHDVTAFLHKKPLQMAHERLRIVPGDVRDAASVAAVMPGHDAVAFVLPATSGGAGVHEVGIANVIYAMAQNRIQRLAAVSAAGTFDRSSTRLSLGYRLLVATALRSTYDDLEAMERRIMASDLEWTIVRPSGLSDEPASGHYRYSFDGTPLAGAKRVSRADVASLVVKALETDTYLRRTIGIAG